MYGGYYGKQLPMFGNKVIGCLECFISLYGTPRNLTWSSLAATANANTNSILVEATGDWKTGEEIVIASTDYDHTHAERRFITAVQANPNGTMTVTLNNNLIYTHESTVSTYGQDSLTIKAEVGLLTRNIKMHGDATSQLNNYGSHLMMAGSAENGLVGHIAYT